MNNTIGKIKIIRDISDCTNENTTICEKIIDAYNNYIFNALVDGNKVVLKNFITYEVITRGERSSKDFRTGKPVLYPPIKSVRCKVSKSLRDAVNGKLEDINDGNLNI